MPKFRRAKLTTEERDELKLRKHLNHRQIKGHYVHKQVFHGDFVHAGDEALTTFLEQLDGKGPFLAACNERHAKMLTKDGYKFFWHVERPFDPDDLMLGKVFKKPEAAGPLYNLKFSSPLKGAFVCERLQKQENLHDYLVALRESVELGAPVALVVPNAHHELVDDHLNLFTAGTLAYNLVRAGWDCKEAIFTYDRRFINVVMKRKDVPEPWPVRVDDIQAYVPFKNIFNYCSSEIVEVYRP